MELGSTRRRMFASRSALVVLAGPGLADADELQALVTLRGRVTESRAGAPVSHAAVSIAGHGGEAVTDAEGRFAFALPLGEVEISVMTECCGLVRRRVHVEADGPELQIHVDQDAVQRAEEIVVETPTFDSPDPAAPAQHTLGAAELRTLASVLADDPLRSVQALPGVASGDDFSATFATRGSGFASAGFYLDGVLMSAPFHTVRDVNDGFSLSVLNGELLESLSLIGSGAPARYGDRTGAVLNLSTREGSREEFVGRASVGVTGLHTTLEGPLGREKRTSWLFSARKSYVDYVLARIEAAPSMLLGYHDATAKLVHHPTASQALSLLVMHGRSRWRSTEPDSESDDLYHAKAGTELVALGWRLLPSTRWWLEASAFSLDETGQNLALDGTQRFGSISHQRGLRGDASRTLAGHRLEAGVVWRRLSERAAGLDFDEPLGRYRTAQSYEAQSAQWGSYLQDTWNTLGERLSLTLGARFDRFDETGQGRLLPRAAASFSLSRGLKTMASFGRYAQFPAFSQLYGENGNAELSAPRSSHFTLALEGLVGDRMRVRLEAYEVEDDDLLFNREMEWRLEAGRVTAPRRAAPLQNALAGSARGVELLVQRRSATGLSAWIAYSLGHARRRDKAGAIEFDSDHDQRHTLTLYASRGLGETLRLTTNYRYGSGFPVAGFFRPDGGDVVLATSRNELRPGAYSRWDARAEKWFRLGGHRLTVYCEVINLLNRNQSRYTGLRHVGRATGTVVLRDDRLLPILPSLGVTLHF
jgi:TonB dependent receptor/Carboxypeptidase regulatory-like domain/TonB-dependent Receptor Plug Domain